MTATGGTTMRHDSGKSQHGNRMHEYFDGRHDDDKGQQGNRATGGTTTATSGPDDSTIN